MLFVAYLMRSFAFILWEVAMRRILSKPKHIENIMHSEIRDIFSYVVAVASNLLASVTVARPIATRTVFIIEM